MIASNCAHSLLTEASATQIPPLLSEETAARSLTAHERVALLLDPETYVELDYQSVDGSEQVAGVIAATGQISTTPVCVFAQDYVATAGVLTSVDLQQIIHLQNIAKQKKMPFIGIFDGQSLSISGGLEAMFSASEMAENIATEKTVSVALILGQNTGFNALLASLFDVVVMTRHHSSLTLTDATITSRITSTQLQESDLGGWYVHAHKSGLVDLVYDNEVLAIRNIRQLFRLLAPTDRHISALSYCPAFDTLIPDDAAKSYDIRELLHELSDERALFELQTNFAPNLITAITRINNVSVGIIASQNAEFAGALDRHACRKAIRLLRLCEAVGLPVINIVDVPGFLPGEDQEHEAIAYEAAELIRAYASFSEPRLTVVINKLFGAAALAFCVRGSETHHIAAWADAQIGLIGSQGALSMTERSEREIKQHQHSLRGEHALHSGYINALIKPGQTKQWLGQTLAVLQTQKNLKSAA